MKAYGLKKQRNIDSSTTTYIDISDYTYATKYSNRLKALQSYVTQAYDPPMIVFGNMDENFHELKLKNQNEDKKSIPEKPSNLSPNSKTKSKTKAKKQKNKKKRNKLKNEKNGSK